MLFANFAEAMAEGRGKAQADTLRKARSETMANRVLAGQIEKIASSKLRIGDIVSVSRANSSLPMARSWKASHRWTSRPSLANPRQSFAKAAAIAPR